MKERLIIMKKIICATLTISVLMLMAVNSFAAVNVNTMFSNTAVGGNVYIDTKVLDGGSGQVNVNNIFQNTVIGGDLFLKTEALGFSSDDIDSVINNVLNGVAIGGSVSIYNQLDGFTAIPQLPDDTKQFSETEKGVLRFINEERSRRGLEKLRLDKSLTDAARYKSQDMINTGVFSHSGSYGELEDLLNKFNVNYSCAGENIAFGYESAADVVNGWMNSEGHRANILDRDFTKLGVGAVKDSNGTIYWTTEFAG